MADNKTGITYEEYLANIKKGIATPSGRCPVTPRLQMLQGRWKLQILYDMCLYDAVRFGQLKKDLPGITNTMLSKSLRELENDGLIQVAQTEHVYYLNPDEALTGSDGIVMSDIVWDGLHLNETGSQMFADYIATHVVRKDVYVKEVCE